jgi:hypothetical protein
MPDPVETASDFESSFSKAVKEAWAPHPTNPVIAKFVADLYKHGKSLLHKWTADENEEKPQVPVIIIQFDTGTKGTDLDRSKLLESDNVRRPVELRRAMETEPAPAMESSTSSANERFKINRTQIFRYNLPELEFLPYDASEIKPSLGTAGRPAELPNMAK